MEGIDNVTLPSDSKETFIPKDTFVPKGIFVTRAVHGSGGSVLDPTRTRPAVRRVGGEGTRNRPPASLGRVGFGFGWCSGRFGRLRKSPDPANVAGIFKKFAGICKNPVDLHQKSPKSAGSPRISPDLTKYGRDLAWISSNVAGSHQISLGSPQMSPDLTKSRLDLLAYCQICI